MKLTKLYEGRIQDHYPGPYGLGYKDNKEIWDDIRSHPLFIDAVLAQCQMIDQQIEAIEQYQEIHPNGINRQVMDGVLSQLADISSVAREIAKDVGWNDVNDIIIAIQRHPEVNARLKEREEKQKRRDNLMSFDTQT